MKKTTMMKARPKTWTKNDLVTKIGGLVLTKNKKTAVDYTEALLEIIKSTLEQKEDVLISGFGKFSIKEKDERKGRNPITGNELMLEPRRVVTFKCSHKLREKINL